ncbi:MAG: serine hydrolase [Bdellovibrionales bacterium]|nr:serine hydrolase [Bdellovibrionales bacterium]
MTSFERNLLLDLQKGLDHPLHRYAPGFQLQVYHHGKKKCDLEYGTTYAFYDLASLTKTILTTPLIMQAVDQGKLSLGSEISDYLNWYSQQGVSVRALLNQTSGVPWWRPFYSKLSSKPFHKLRWAELKPYLNRARVRPSGRSVYSDLGFLLLGYLAEEVFQSDLQSLLEVQRQKLGLDSLHFNKNNVRTYSKSLYAPTERCRRRGLLQGQVHDDNCFALGGISSHAGLFGKIGDVSKWGLKVFRAGYTRPSGNVLCSKPTFLQFSKRAVPTGVGDWALGWWKPSPRGKPSSAGKMFSRASVGGLGFTGTSIWYDPKADLLVTLVSNRVHPSRRNKKISELRPKLHDLIYAKLVLS